MQTSERGAQLLVGILVGGAARRMGGQPKGLLLAPGGQERIVPRLLRLIQESLPLAERMLLGAHPAYAELGAPTLADAAPDAGPLGGLVSLLREAKARQRRGVILLACDLPRLTGELLVRLADFESTDVALAPVSEGRYEPLFARYAIECLQPAERLLSRPDRSLQSLLRSVGTTELPLSDAERLALVDWDEPADLAKE